jgi:hypothetical protein
MAGLNRYPLYIFSLGSMHIYKKEFREADERDAEEK